MVGKVKYENHQRKNKVKMIISIIWVSITGSLGQSGWAGHTEKESAQGKTSMSQGSWQTKGQKQESEC